MYYLELGTELGIFKDWSGGEPDPGTANPNNTRGLPTCCKRHSQNDYDMMPPEQLKSVRNRPHHTRQGVQHRI